MLCIITPEYESADDEGATSSESDSDPTTDEEDEPTDGDSFRQVAR
jgi:hypothetical protein